MFNNKGKQNTVATTKHDLGSDFADETKITTMGFKGKDSIESNSSLSSILNETQHEKERIELFHIGVISKHTKIYYLIVVHKKTSFMKTLSKNLIWKHILILNHIL